MDFNNLYSRVCYNERMLQRTVFISKIWMLQRTQTLHRTRRSTVGRRSTRVRMMCRAFIRASVIIFVIVCEVKLSVWFSYLLICAFSSENIFLLFCYIILYYFYSYIFDFVLYLSCLNGCVGW